MSKSSTEANGASPSPTEFDLIIIGAGISGINTAYYAHTQVPGISYAILDGRSQLGGTWDLFKYPGIRSDSGMDTFGFSWNPWNRPESLASGERIRNYMQESAEKYGIDKNIRFNHKVLAADWSTSSKSWSLSVKNDRGQAQTYRANFIILGTGYYDYNKPLEASIPGLDSFGGPIIHPQFWPEDLDYSGKDVVVIGSGATAVTLIPSMVDQVKSITMLQRSPTYILARPNIRQESVLAKVLRFCVPLSVRAWFRRARSIVTSTLFYNYCMRYPQKARALLQSATAKQLPASVAWDPHFKPRYGPWQQRMCLSPDGDFYAALRSGRARVVTDTIAAVTSTEVQLQSGQAPLRPDIIVVATGLKLQFGGGVRLSIDGEAVACARKYTWKGSMIQDVPNLMFVFGYVNASWTMGADVVAQHLVRVLRLMRRRGARVAVPRLEAAGAMPRNDIFRLSSTYTQVANRLFPMGGVGVWDHKRSYIWDMADALFGSVTRGLVIE